MQRPCSVHLLREQNPRQAMRQGQIRERPGKIGPSSAGARHSVRPAYDETQVPAVALPTSKPLGQALARELPSTLVEQHDLFIRLDFTQDSAALVVAGTCRLVALATARRRKHIETEFPVIRKPGGVGIESRVNPAGLAISDRDQPYVHGLAVGGRKIGG